MMSVLSVRKGGSHPYCTAVVKLCRENRVLSCSKCEGHQKSRTHSKKGNLHGEVSESHNMYFSNLRKCSLEHLAWV